MRRLILPLLLSLWAVPSLAQRPAVHTTIQTTSTAASSLLVGCALNVTSGCTGGLDVGPVVVNEGGVNIVSNVPSVTTMKLYNNAGTLTWNGIALATGASLSGTTGSIPVFTASNAVGDSIMVQSGGNLITLTGTMNATTAYQLNGTSINTAGTLTNVAYLNAANTFSNASGQTFAGGISLSGGAPSTHGIVIPSAVPGSTLLNLYNNANTLTWANPASFTTLDLNTGGLAWGDVSKSGSSLADLATRAVANLSDGSNVALLSATNAFTAKNTITVTSSASATNTALQLLPSSGSQYIALAVGTTGARLISRETNTDTYWTSNTDLYTHTTTAAASYIQQIGGIFNFVSAPSASAGAAQTFVNTMSLSAAGLLTVSGEAFVISATGTSTQYRIVRMGNTGGDAFFGVNNSTGVGTISGGTPYAAVVTSNNATALDFGTNGARRGGFSATGNWSYAGGMVDSVGTPTCGTACSTVAGKDYAFFVTPSSGSDVTVNFGNTWTNPPICVVTAAVAAGSSTEIYNIKTISTTAITVGVVTSGTPDAYNVLCRGY